MEAEVGCSDEVKLIHRLRRLHRTGWAATKEPWDIVLLEYHSTLCASSAFSALCGDGSHLDWVLLKMEPHRRDTENAEDAQRVECCSKHGIFIGVDLT